MLRRCPRPSVSSWLSLTGVISAMFIVENEVDGVIFERQTFPLALGAVTVHPPDLARFSV